MRTIYKYPLTVTGHNALRMPKGAEVLTVQMQHGVPCLWVLVDTDAPECERVLRIYGTGHPISDDENALYVGTFQLSGGAFVFHVFEVVP